MELETDVPARITPTDAEMKDGKYKVKTVLSKTNETTRTMMTKGSILLAGLGMILLILAVSLLRTQSAPRFVEESPTDHLPE
jgi:hypothetical protein